MSHGLCMAVVVSWNSSDLGQIMPRFVLQQLGYPQDQFARLSPWQAQFSNYATTSGRY